MSLKTDDEKLIIGYLLGDLPEEEQTRLEEHFLRDAEYREIMRSIEDDLVDEYVRGELAPHERELFEKRFTSLPHRRRKVEFAKDLMKTLTATGPAVEETTATATGARGRAPVRWPSLLSFWPTFHWSLRFALTAAAVLLAIGGVWLITEIRRTRTQPERLQAERRAERQQAENSQQVTEGSARHEEPSGQPKLEQEQRAPSGELAAQQPLRGREQSNRLRKQTNRSSPPRQLTVASFALSLGMTRNSDETAELIVPRGTQLIRLRLNLERGDEYPSYHAELRRAGSDLLWRRDKLLAQPATAGPSVILSLPANLLTSGEYELKLTGVNDKAKLEEIGYYSFRIMKK